MASLEAEQKASLSKDNLVEKTELLDTLFPALGPLSSVGTSCQAFAAVRNLRQILYLAIIIFMVHH